MADKPIKILMIDDEEQILFALRAVFQFQGWDSISAGDVPTGLELFRNEQPDLVLIDYHLPKVNGIKGVEMIRELDPETTSFCLDTYWIQHGGGDVCSWIEKLAGRIDILHLKDMRCFRNEERRVVHDICEIGRGNLDFHRILPTAIRTGVKHFCVEQDNCPVDFHESLKFSSDYLHAHFM
jgi:chemotaxis response regulator CheB